MSTSDATTAEWICAPELACLTAVEELTLYTNSLSGSVPSELGNLTTLTTLGLYIYTNSLSGSVPSELASLAALEELGLYNNLTVCGPVPPELGRLTALTSLGLITNGSLPSELGSLTACPHVIRVHRQQTECMDLCLRTRQPRRTQLPRAVRQHPKWSYRRSSPTSPFYRPSAIHQQSEWFHTFGARQPRCAHEPWAIHQLPSWFHTFGGRRPHCAHDPRFIHQPSLWHAPPVPLRRTYLPSRPHESSPWL